MSQRSEIARRVLAGGVVEEAGYFNGNRNLFVISHWPSTPPTDAVLICSPILAEFARNYRREVLTARSLAAQGIAVQRFHYRGTGRSTGLDGAATMQTMVEDATYAATRLSGLTGLAPAILGIRWGSLVGAGAGLNLGTSRFALWDPVLDPTSYVRDVLRVRQIHELKEAAADRLSTDDLFAALRRDGSVAVLDYELHLSVFESAFASHPLTQLQNVAKAALLIQVARSNSPRPELASFKQSLEEAGCAVELRITGEDEAWWFEGDRFESEENRHLTAKLIGFTTDWLMASTRPE